MELLGSVALNGILVNDCQEIIMKRVWFVALAGGIATATMALAMGDASAVYRTRAVGVAAYHGAYAPGVYRRTARRAYRRAAYAGVVAPGVGVGWSNASYWGAPGWNSNAAAVAAGTVAATSAVGYAAYGDLGAFNAGIYRRAGEIYLPTPVARAAARRMGHLAPEAAAVWEMYPTRAEYAGGYVRQGYTGYYGPQCHPWIDAGCY